MIPAKSLENFLNRNGGMGRRPSDINSHDSKTGIQKINKESEMKEDSKIHVFGNTDNANLEPQAFNNGLVIGYVDEVNGAGGKEIPDFIPTQDELLQIVKYWVKVRLDIVWFYYNTGWTGSSENRLESFADRRIYHIVSLVGEEKVKEAIDEVEMRFREQQHDNMKLWQIFRKGDEAQRETIMQEYERCTSGDPEASARWAFAPGITLTSPPFTDGQSIPDRYTSRGMNISPPLAWGAPPDGTRSLAITMDDLDSSERLFSHWILFNIPHNLRELSEAIPLQAQLPNGSLQGENGYRKIGYFGPGPMSPFHRYGFHIYALDQLLDLEAGISRNQLLNAMEGHVLDEGNLTAISPPL